MINKEKVFIADAAYENIYEILPAMIDSLELNEWYKNLSKKTVFIKPNILGLFLPENHATTHPAVIRALVKFFRKAGALVKVGDNSGVGGRGLIQRVITMTEIEEASDGAFVDVTKNSIEVPVQSRFMDSTWVSKDMLESDILINVPKMKTHSLTVVTGAVKNMFGIVAGNHKSRCHAVAAKVDDFGEVLSDIFMIRPPDLSILDAIVAQEGNGPSGGDPKPVGKILASTNAVALDTVMCKIMGFPPDKVHHLVHLKKHGMGSLNYNDIDIIGSVPQDLPFNIPAAIQNFKFIGRLVNFILFGALLRSKLRLKKDLCSRCYICVAGCPTEAMTVQDDKYPGIEKKKCIKCLCCNELCPESAWEIRGKLKQYQGRAW
ncbi:MAG: DUF362 domain-containing protein [bacterium]|nr:DUF362 domain-containing protein [bacterium]